MAFEKEINDYENLRKKYQTVVIDRMDREEYRQFNEILFSTHSCAIEGNSFSVDDTRELKEKGLGMIPTGKSLLEAFEMLDHFKAYEYVLNNTGHALDEAFLKEINRLVAKVPQLLASTERAIASSAAHPVVLAARFHGFYEYLHPFRDGNGRTGRLVSNHILLRMGHPLIIIPSSCRQEYITSLRTIRTEGTDEHLIRFFFKMAMTRMADEIGQKEKNTQRFRTFMF